MIVSLNLPENVVAFIDRKATDAKQSRSAWMTSALHNMQLIDSQAGKKGLAHLLLGVMAQGALRCGQSLDHVRKVFPQWEHPRALEHACPVPQLPAGTDAGPAAVPPTPLDAAPVTRRRPYQRAGKRSPTRQS